MSEEGFLFRLTTFLAARFRIPSKLCYLTRREEKKSMCALKYGATDKRVRMITLSARTTKHVTAQPKECATREKVMWPITGKRSRKQSQSKSEDPPSDMNTVRQST